jgi:hypothetical protein
MNSALSGSQKSFSKLNARLTFEPYSRLGKAVGAAPSAVPPKIANLCLASGLRFSDSQRSVRGSEHAQTLWHEFGIDPL